MKQVYPSFKKAIQLIAFSFLLFAFVTTNAQVGIGTNTPNASAKLDITATNKGLLPPRVALTGTADVSTITSPATALLVYNTATAGSSPNNVIPGYYYYNGTNWVNLITTATSGVPYSGATGTVNLGSYDLTVNGVTVGLGHGQNSLNTALGGSALAASNFTGSRNTAVGNQALIQYAGTSTDNNTGVGYFNMGGLTTGSANTSIGGETMLSLASGSNNTAIGNHTLMNTTSNFNTAVGSESGDGVTSGNNNTFLGYNTDVSSGHGTIVNATAIGSGASVTASNTIQLGNASVSNVNTSGTINLATGTATKAALQFTTGVNLTTPVIGAVEFDGANLYYTDYNSTRNTLLFSTGSGATDLGRQDVTVNGITVGQGGGGHGVPNSNLGNTVVGNSALQDNTTGFSNTAIGFQALSGNTRGNNNTASGNNSLYKNDDANDNTGYGNLTLYNNFHGSSLTAIGSGADVDADGYTNATAIGFGAIITGSNMIQLGADGTNSTTAITNVKTSGTLTLGAITLPKTDGTTGQVLSTNGSGVVGWTNSTVTGINIDQTNNNVAIGNSAGQTSQAANSVAIGNSAGQTNQGSNSVAIGNSAGSNNQAASSIVLNASGSTLDAGNSGFFVSPISSSSSTQPVLMYNTTTKEISSSSAKTFVINHPTKPDSYLVHACLEGPEAGVYYRGEAKIENNKSVSVSLPDYVSSFAGNFSIQITPIYIDDTDENIVYSTSRVKNNAFTVHGKNGSFYWLVYAQRGKIEVEPKKSDVQVGGDGPYKYIKSQK